MTKPTGFDAVIEALTIFRKYENPTYPFCCEHDILYVHVDYADVSEEDRARLSDLDFEPNGDVGNFLSHRYGSA